MDYFERQLVKEKPKLYKQAFNYVNNKDDAEDLVQDTFLYMLSKYRDKGIVNIGAMCNTILKHLFFNKLDTDKARKKREKLSVDELSCHSEYFIKESKAEEDKKISKIVTLIDRLPEQSKIDLAKVVKGTKQIEIAAELGVDAQVVNRRFAQIRSVLRDEKNIGHIVFKDVPGWEGIYEVSRDGQVRNKIHNTMLAATTKVWFMHEGRSASMLRERAMALAWIPNPNGYRFFNNGEWVKMNSQPRNIKGINQCSRQITA